LELVEALASAGECLLPSLAGVSEALDDQKLDHVFEARSETNSPDREVQLLEKEPHLTPISESCQNIRLRIHLEMSSWIAVVRLTIEVITEEAFRASRVTEESRPSR
jgi:hypothetical protein